MLKERKPIETIEAFCLICGEKSHFFSWEPVDFPCKRNSFFCKKCGSIARNRHIAKVIIEIFESGSSEISLNEFALRTDIRILNTCLNGAIHEALKLSKNYIVSEYYDNAKSGEIRGGVHCQDLENTTYEDNTFDLIITEDVFEHISDPKRAFLEAKRILKVGGYSVATIPVFWSMSESVTRATKNQGNVQNIHEPVYHGDPNRPEGILVYTDFGTDIVDKYCAIVGATKIFASHENAFDEKAYGIYNNWVFVSQKS